MHKDKDFDDTFLEIQALREKIIHARGQICSAKAALEQKLSLCQSVLDRKAFPYSDTKSMPQSSTVSAAFHNEISGELLQLREKLYQSVLNQTTDGFLCINRDYEILDVNSAFCHLLDCPRAGLLTKSLFDFLEDQAHTSVSLEDCYTTFEQELLFKTRQGPRYCRAAFTPVCDMQGQLLYLFAFVADNSAWKSGSKPEIQ